MTTNLQIGDTFPDPEMPDHRKKLRRPSRLDRDHPGIDRVRR
jgi:hypothetical protein